MPGKRNRPSKKRSVAYVGTTKEIVDRITLTLDETTGELTIGEVNPASLTVKHYYKRDSGKEKILFSAPASKSDIRFLYLDSIRRDFDYLVAVDTNTRVISGRRVSVAVAYATPLLRSAATRIPYIPIAAYGILDVASSINPERLGWHLILQHHVIPTHQAQRLKVGLVVDSELGVIPQINERSECYYDRHALPPYVKLIYASDAAAETLPNQMIRYCDKQAERMMSELHKHLPTLNPAPNGDHNYYAFIKILFREEPGDNI